MRDLNFSLIQGRSRQQNSTCTNLIFQHSSLNFTQNKLLIKCQRQSIRSSHGFGYRSWQNTGYLSPAGFLVPQPLRMKLSMRRWRGPGCSCAIRPPGGPDWCCSGYQSRSPASGLRCTRPFLLRRVPRFLSSRQQWYPEVSPGYKIAVSFALRGGQKERFAPDIGVNGLWK